MEESAALNASATASINASLARLLVYAALSECAGNASSVLVLDDQGAPESCISLDDLYAFVWPTAWHWLFMAANLLVFLVGLFGNALVCVSVWQSRRSVRSTATHPYIANLALADMLVLIVCQPSTVVWDVLKSWLFGVVTCKVVLYLQVRFVFGQYD